MKKRNLNIFDAGIAFVMAFVLAQFTSIIGISLTQTIMEACGKSATSINAFWDTAAGYLLQAIYMNIAFVLIFIWYYKGRNKQQLFHKPNQSTLKYFGLCVLLGIASLFLLSGTLNYFQLLVDKLGFTSSSLSYELNSPKNYLISLISLALIPAVCEELIFRGIITTALKQKGEIFAIVLSSIMFAIFHFSPSQLLYPICFGLILSTVYLSTNNIIFPILLHFINNALSLSIQYFSSDTSVAFTHSMSNLIYSIVTLIIWIYLMYLLFKNFKKNKLSNDNQLNPDEQNNVITNEQSTPLQQSQIDKNEKINKIVLYGSIAIMIFLYVILISI